MDELPAAAEINIIRNSEQPSLFITTRQLPGGNNNQVVHEIYQHRELRVEIQGSAQADGNLIDDSHDSLHLPWFS